MFCHNCSRKCQSSIGLMSMVIKCIRKICDCDLNDYIEVEIFTNRFPIQFMIFIETLKKF
jgi:hypothetical protein